MMAITKLVFAIFLSLTSLCVFSEELSDYDKKAINELSADVGKVFWKYPRNCENRSAWKLYAVPSHESSELRISWPVQVKVVGVAGPLGDHQFFYAVDVDNGKKAYMMQAMQEFPNREDYDSVFKKNAMQAAFEESLKCVSAVNPQELLGSLYAIMDAITKTRKKEYKAESYQKFAEQVFESLKDLDASIQSR